MKAFFAILVASTFCFSAHAGKLRDKVRAASKACVAEGKVNAKGKADRACVKAKLKK